MVLRQVSDEATQGRPHRMKLLARFVAVLALAQGNVWAVERLTEPQPTHANVAYGPHALNVLDLWLAAGEGPRPVVVYIHGGGWIGGDKTNNDDRQNGDAIRHYLE